MDPLVGWVGDTTNDDVVVAAGGWSMDVPLSIDFDPLLFAVEDGGEWDNS